MSDNCNSAGSSGSSTNSWTLLSPEEAAVENVGPVDDGTESLGDVPSLSEDVAGAGVEFKPSDMSVETVFSEEGHQVCQETSPESSEGPFPSSPSPLESPELDLESQPPIIHDIVTSSPADNEPLGATPFVTNIDYDACELPPVEREESSPEPPGADGPVAIESEFDTNPAEDSLDVPAEPEGVEETPSATGPPSSADASLESDTRESPSPVPESPEPEAVGATDATEGAELFRLAATEPVDDGLRRRHLPDSTEAPGPKISDEEEEVDEEEELAQFRLAEKEKKQCFSLNKCIVGAVVLLFLGSLFLSGDFDVNELSDGEQGEDGNGGAAQDMREMLDKLMQENQQITQLEDQLQSQKEELDAALKAVAQSGDEKSRADLEKENADLRMELLSLPDLKRELESLRARMTELSPPAEDQDLQPRGPTHQKPAAPEREGKEEPHRRKVPPEEIRKMKNDRTDRKRVRDNLEEIQKKISERVKRWGEGRPREASWKEGRSKNDRKKEEKERRSEKDQRQSKEGGREDGREKEWRPPKHDSHKESWRKHQDEWERKKGERRQDREERRKEKPWHGSSAKNPRQHQHHSSRKPPQAHDNFWRDQEQKLRRNVGVRVGCVSVDDCAAKEGLYPVELPEFEELLEGYLSKLEGSPPASKDAIRRLTGDFFQDGVFIHDRVPFADFAEDVADVLEDMADVLEEGGGKRVDSLEEEMEEFEREALWKFAATF